MESGASSEGPRLLTLRREEYSGLLVQRLSQLLGSDGSGGLVDVTLACEGQYLQAHRLILASCSPLFKRILEENPCDTPIIIVDQASMRLLKKLVNFLYSGEVTLTRSEVSEFSLLAERLGVAGLAPLLERGMREQEEREIKKREAELQKKRELERQRQEKRAREASQFILPSIKEEGNETLTLPEDLPIDVPIAIQRPPHLPRHITLPSAKEASRRNLTCDICKSVFKRRNAIKHHILKFHPGADTGLRMSCNLCGQMFELKTQVAEHKRIAHDDKRGDRVLCVLCQRTFKNNASLKVHMCCYHNKRDTGKLHACQYCGKTFLVKCDVRRHELSVHRHKPRVTCGLCQNTFKHKNSLRQHMLARHRGHRETFTCEVCQKKYQRHADLIRHMRNEHMEKEETEVKCEYCQRVFKHRDSLYGHIWRYHKERAQAAQQAQRALEASME